ncbi:hypothetical protein LR48_Vigan02g082500 [Vigna angularis]|uniref:Uncharacterized protein n=1 Tax=Phaseolus angularis TaxID=3914 RepID=A0A0L9TVU4_PHAAN|nr:hypothetical protein LR48_Vigan02g082500 [Vigna angularis]
MVSNHQPVVCRFSRSSLCRKKSVECLEILELLSRGEWCALSEFHRVKPMAMALQSSRGHHKCTTRHSSVFILSPDSQFRSLHVKMFGLD